VSDYINLSVTMHTSFVIALYYYNHTTTTAGIRRRQRPHYRKHIKIVICVLHGPHFRINYR